MRERTQSVERSSPRPSAGVLVTRLWYIREVDPYEKIVTGMTRDADVPGGERQDSVRAAQFPL